ncbi:MAG: polysaccharide deacetylase family protein [Candidatus Poribacteria bacterium]|nr:polysaccharide deacetylase family protein [Candidatus Poribacteria bacterium]
MRVFFLFLVVSVMATASIRTARAATLAERLGYAPDARLLIVHGDDIGMCHGGNVAAMGAIASGAIQSGSIMVPCPWFSEIAAACRENPQWDLGLHLTLTSEWKHYRWRSVADPSDVSGLLDKDGYLHRDVLSVVLNATAAEVETELRAQIDRALAFGIQPTHFDSHMGTLFAREDFFEVYYRLGVEYGIPVMIPSPNSNAAERGRQQGMPVTGKFIELVESGRVPILDELVTGVERRELDPRAEDYFNVIRGLKPGVTQIIVHLGDGGDEMKAITGSWEARWNDYRIFSDEKTRALIESEGIRLIGWREIAHLMAK